jgi:hypothetical protein
MWQRGMTDIGGAIGYVSHEGIVTCNGAGGSLESSQRFWTRKDWAARFTTGQLYQLRLNTYDGGIIGLLPPGSNTNGFMVRQDEGTGQMTQLSDVADATFILPETDQCYLLYGGSVYQFMGDDSYRSFDWWSKDFIVERPSNFGALQIVMDPSHTGVTFTVYADGVAVATGTTTGGILRLPSGFKARRWSIRLQGNAWVREVYIATSPTELASV